MEESSSEDEELEENEEDEDMTSEDDWRIHESLYIESDSEDSLIDESVDNSMNALHFQYDNNEGSSVDYVETRQDKITDKPEFYAAETNINNLLQCTVSNEVDISINETIEKDFMIENLNHDLFQNEFEDDRQEIFKGINLYLDTVLSLNEASIYLQKINN